MGKFSGSKCDELVHIGKLVATRAHKFHDTLVVQLNEIHFRQIYIKFYYSRFGKGRVYVRNHDLPQKFTESSPI